MADASEMAAAIDAATIDTFADRLDSYAAGLPDRERRILAAMIVGAMHPLDRVRYLHPEGAGILSDDEAAFLAELAAETGPGAAGG